jgi:hypothetical protein
VCVEGAHAGVRREMRDAAAQAVSGSRTCRGHGGGKRCLMQTSEIGPDGEPMMCPKSAQVCNACSRQTDCARLPPSLPRSPSEANPRISTYTNLRPNNSLQVQVCLLQVADTRGVACGGLGKKTREAKGFRLYTQKLEIAA